MDSDSQKEIQNLEDLFSAGFIQEEEYKLRLDEIKERFGLSTVPVVKDVPSESIDNPFVSDFSSTENYYSPTSYSPTTNRYIPPEPTSSNVHDLNYSNPTSYEIESTDTSKIDSEFEKKGNSHCKESCSCHTSTCYICHFSYPSCCEEEHNLVCTKSRSYSCPFRDYGCYESGMTRFEVNQHIASGCSADRDIPPCPGVKFEHGEMILCDMWSCICGYTNVYCDKKDHMTACVLIPRPCPCAQYGCEQEKMNREEMRVHLDSGDCMVNNEELRKKTEEMDLTGDNDPCIFSNLCCPLVAEGCTATFETREQQSKHLTQCTYYAIICPSCRSEVSRSNYYPHIVSCEHTKSLVVPPMGEIVMECINKLNNTVGMFDEK